VVYLYTESMHMHVFLSTFYQLYEPAKKIALAVMI
jgi:hypothetical protein